MTANNTEPVPTIEDFLEQHEQEIRRDIANHISGNKTRSSDVTREIFRRKLQLICASERIDENRRHLTKMRRSKRATPENLLMPSYFERRNHTLQTQLEGETQ